MNEDRVEGGNIGQRQNRHKVFRKFISLVNHTSKFNQANMENLDAS